MPATPLSPEGIVGGAGKTVMVKVALPVPPTLIALMVAATVPVDKGAPEISPVVALKLRPLGNPVALKLVGVLLPVIW